MEELFDTTPFSRPIEKKEAEPRIPLATVPYFNPSKDFEDNKLDKIISLDVYRAHEGFAITYRDEKYRVRVDMGSNKIILKTLYWGVSIDGRHYNGWLHLPQVNYQTEEDYVAKANRASMWLPDCNEQMLVKIQLTRKLTGKEIRQRPERFKTWREGQYFNGFDSLEQLVAKAKRVTDKFFPGFKLERE